MRTTIRMDAALAREAKRYAEEANLTFTEVVERALSELLAKNRLNPKQKTLKALPTFGNKKKKITWEQLQAAIEQQQYEDDLHGLGLKRDDAA